VNLVLSESAPGIGWHCLTVMMMLPRWLMKGCMGQRFCNAVVWIAELVRVKKVGN